MRRPSISAMISSSLTACDVVRGDRLAVAEDGEAVGYVAHFGEPMRDIDHQAAVGGEAAWPGQAAIRSRAAPAPMSPRRGSAPWDRVPAPWRSRRPGARRASGGGPPGRAAWPGNRSARTGRASSLAQDPRLDRCQARQRLAAEPDVALDRQVGNQREFLEHGRDAGRLGGARIGCAEGLAAEQDGARSRRAPRRPVPG